MNCKQIKYKRSQNLSSKHRAVKNVNKVAKIIFQVHCSILSTCANQCTKHESFVRNLFSKCEYICIKLWIYSHLLGKSLTKNFIFWVVNITGVTIESFKFLFKPNCKSLVYFTSINTWHKLVSSLLFRNQFSACSKGLEVSAQELLHDNQYTFRT